MKCKNQEGRGRVSDRLNMFERKHRKRMKEECYRWLPKVGSGGEKGQMDLSFFSAHLSTSQEEHHDQSELQKQHDNLLETKTT